MIVDRFSFIFCLDFWQWCWGLNPGPPACQVNTMLLNYLLTLLFHIFETRYHKVAQACFELVEILQDLKPKCQGYRHTLPHLVYEQSSQVKKLVYQWVSSSVVCFSLWLAIEQLKSNASVLMYSVSVHRHEEIHQF